MIGYLIVNFYNPKHFKPMVGKEQISFSALTLLVAQQAWHLACKKTVGLLLVTI